MDLEIARGSVQLFNTIVHFPANIVIQAGVLETWAIVTVNTKSLQELIGISPGRSCQPQMLSGKVHVMFSDSCHAIWVNEQTQRSLLQRPFGQTTQRSKDFPRHDFTFFRFIAAQTATSPLEEIEELKAGNCHCSTLPKVNLCTSLVPGVRQCWMCTTSVQDDALSSHQIVKRGTRRLKSCGTISAPWSPSFSRSQGSQKNEASSVFETTGNCCLHLICLPLNQQHPLLPRTVRADRGVS